MSASKLCQTVVTSSPWNDLVAEPEEDVLDLALDLGQQMEPPARRALARERDVHRRARVQLVELGAAQLLLPRLDGALDPLAERVQRHPRLAVADLAKRELERALPPEVLDADLLDVVGRLGGGDRGECVPLERCRVHGGDSSGIGLGVPRHRSSSRWLGDWEAPAESGGTATGLGARRCPGSRPGLHKAGRARSCHQVSEGSAPRDRGVESRCERLGRVRTRLRRVVGGHDRGRPTSTSTSRRRQTGRSWSSRSGTGRVAIPIARADREARHRDRLVARDARGRPGARRGRRRRARPPRRATCATSRSTSRPTLVICPYPQRCSICPTWQTGGSVFERVAARSPARAAASPGTRSCSTTAIAARLDGQWQDEPVRHRIRYVAGRQPRRHHASRTDAGFSLWWVTRGEWEGLLDVVRARDRGALRLVRPAAVRRREPRVRVGGAEADDPLRPDRALLRPVEPVGHRGRRLLRRPRARERRAGGRARRRDGPHRGPDRAGRRRR